MLFGEGAGGFGLAQLFVVRGQGGQVGPGFLVVSALLAVGEFQAATELLRVVVRGGVERVELERVLPMPTVVQKTCAVSQDQHTGRRPGMTTFIEPSGDSHLQR